MVRHPHQERQETRPAIPAELRNLSSEISFESTLAIDVRLNRYNENLCEDVGLGMLNQIGDVTLLLLRFYLL